MAILVAYRMELQPRRGQSTAEMVDEVCDLFSEFVVKHFRRHGVETFPLHFDGRPDHPDKDNRLVATRSESDKYTLATVDWEVIPEQDTDHVLRVSFTCSSDQRAVEVHYRGQLDLRSLLVAPGKKKMKFDPCLLTPSEFFTKVLGQWTASVDGWPVPVAAKLLKADDVKAFVEDTLLNPKRMLPVILLAADGRFKATPSSIQFLQGHVLGVAQVSALMDKQATEKLQAELGPDRACSIGILRFYYPMFTRNCPPRNHPLFRIEELREVMKDFEAFLHRESMKFLVQQSPDGPLTKAARAGVAEQTLKTVDLFRDLQARLATTEEKLRGIESHRDRLKEDRDEIRTSLRTAEAKLVDRNRAYGDLATELAACKTRLAKFTHDLEFLGAEHKIATERLRNSDQTITEMESHLSVMRERLQGAGHRSKTNVETDNELERAWQENDRTLAQLEYASQEIARLQRELHVCRENLDFIAANPTGFRKLPDDTPSMVETLATPKSVLESLQLASQRHADILEIWDDAWSSAKKSHYPGPTRVMEALVAIAEIGRMYFEAMQAGQSIGPLDQAFREKVPFKYASGESQITMAMYGHERKFQGPAQRREIQRHLTLGGGGNCLQLYFDFDEVRRKVIIAYCGQHLSHYRQS